MDKNRNFIKLRSPDDLENPSITKQRYNMISLKQQLEWVKRQIEYLTFAENHIPNFTLKRGEVYEFDWGVNLNAEFSHRHYGVVLADSYNNNPLVLVCPLKTNRFGGNPYSDVNLGIINEIKTDCETLAVANQIRALDKLRLYVNPIINEYQSLSQVVKLAETQLEEIEKAIIRIIRN